MTRHPPCGTCEAYGGRQRVYTASANVSDAEKRVPADREERRIGRFTIVCGRLRFEGRRDLIFDTFTNAASK